MKKHSTIMVLRVCDDWPALILVMAAHAVAFVALYWPLEAPSMTPNSVFQVTLIAPAIVGAVSPHTPKLLPMERSKPEPIAASPTPLTTDTAPTKGIADAPAETTAASFDAAYLQNPKPPYPLLSRRLGERGKVLLLVQVAADGAPVDVVIKASSGSPRLDQAALETVRKWRFVPAKQGNRPVAAQVIVPIVFNLEG